MRWVLIRSHRSWIWEELAEYLKVKIKEVGETKALILTGDSKECLKEKLKRYNKNNFSDFYV